MDPCCSEAIPVISPVVWVGLGIELCFNNKAFSIVICDMCQQQLIKPLYTHGIKQRGVVKPEEGANCLPVLDRKAYDD